MTRPAAALLAAFLGLCVAFPFSSSSLSAQDEKKPGKKPPPEKMDKDAKKDKGEAAKDGDDAKTESKAREPADEKQKKQFEKIRKDVEKKFKKGKKEQVWVYATREETAERIEPTETPQPPPGPQGPPGKGGMNKYDKSGRFGAGTGTGTGPGNRQQGGGAGHSAGGWEPVVKSTAYMTKDADEAIEKVYAFLVELLPAAPEKKKKMDSDEPPVPRRTLLEVKVYPATKDGEKAAEAYHEQLEKKFQKEHQQQEGKKMARKKGG